MDRASRVSISIVCFILTLIILGGVGGFVYLIRMAGDYYTQEKLQGILDKTADEEGFCLTDVITEADLEYDGMPYVYQDACVSIYSINKDFEKSSTMLGSGVCIASKGYEYGEGLVIESGSYIVTNYHVVENVVNALSYEIKVFPNDYTNVERYGIQDISYIGELLWYDSYLDEAIIYVEENIDWVKMKDRSIDCNDDEMLKTGEKAFVIGTPLQIENQNTITKGTIYSEDNIYTCTVSDRSLSNIYEYLIPIQIEINNGNSGGGLFDKNGYLVGQPTLGASNSTAAGAVNYAIPIYSAMLVLNNIVKSNETETSVVIYGLKSLNFVVVDSLEYDVICSYDLKTVGGRIYFYGKYYTKGELAHTGDGVKVVYTSSLKINVGDIITKAKINDTEIVIENRNDLIFVLLQYTNTDALQFEVNGEYVTAA